jgi:hypothetical protein
MEQVTFPASDITEKKAEEGGAVQNITRVNAPLPASSTRSPSQPYEQNVEDELDDPFERCAPRSRIRNRRSQSPGAIADADSLHGRRVPQRRPSVQLALPSALPTDPAVVSQRDLLRRSRKLYRAFLP